MPFAKKENIANRRNAPLLLLGLKSSIFIIIEQLKYKVRSALLSN
jgi:hypothetical protein